MSVPVQPVQTAIPFKRDGAGADAPLASGGAAVLVISLIAIVAVLVVRKKLKLGGPLSGKSGLLNVLETQRMGPRALVSVVEFDGTRYLIAQGEQGITCIDRKPAPEQA